MVDRARTAQAWVSPNAGAVVRMLIADESESILGTRTATSWSWKAYDMDAADPSVEIGGASQQSYSGLLFDPPRNGPEWDQGGPGYNFAHAIYKDDLEWPPGGSRVLLEYEFLERSGEREKTQRRSVVLQLRTR